MPMLNFINFEQIQWNKVFCRMYGLAVIEVMTMSGHLSNIDEITSLSLHFQRLQDFAKKASNHYLPSLIYIVPAISLTLFPIIIHLFLHEDNTYAYSIFLASNVLLHPSRPKHIMEGYRQWRTHENTKMVHKIVHLLINI
jgi:hypothetical protein